MTSSPSGAGDIESGDYARGRSCDTCTMCCKLLSITELSKPMGQWCRHCAPGKGCKIYPDRPAECRTFVCGYLQPPGLDDVWYPARSKLVVAAEPRRITVHVDPARPLAWRDEPFFSQIKRWARAAAAVEDQVLIYTAGRVTVVLPESEVDIGEVSDDEMIITIVGRRADGTQTWDATKMKRDDPRIAGREAGDRVG